MAIKDEKGNYWTAVEDDLFYRWCSKDTKDNEKTILYEMLIPKLRHMARIILERYFGNNIPNYKELIEDAIQNLLVKAVIDKNRQNKAYSYISAALKYYYYDEVIIRVKWKKNTQFDKNYDVSNDEHIHPIENPEFDEFDYNERQLMLNKIILNIKESIKFEEKKLINIKRRKEGGLKLIYNTIKYLNYTIEYFEEYFPTSNVCTYSLIEYIQSKGDLNLKEINNLNRRFLNINVSVRAYNNRQSKIERKYTKESISYIQDDYAPEEKKTYSRTCKSELAKKIENYNDYSYF